MQIVLLGAGSLACSLGPALQRQGHQVVQVYSRTEKSASGLADRLNCKHTTSLHSLLQGADIYFVCLKDEALVQLAPQFTQDHKDSLFVHVAGSIPMDALPTFRRGVMWPVHSFCRDKATTDWKDIPLFIEASTPQDFDILQTLADSLSDHVYQASSDARPLIHLAAEFCNNFANHCYSMAESILHDCGLPFSTMYHIIQSTTDSALTLSPRQSQSGPACRHDKAVMDSDRELLKNRPDLLEIYNLLSNHIEKEYD